MTPAYTRPIRNPLEDPAHQEQFRRFVLGEVERVNVQIPRLRLDQEEAGEQLPQGPGAPIIRAVPVSMRY